MQELKLNDIYGPPDALAVLVSGDGDFVPAIKKVQKLGKRVENAYFSANRSDFLKSVCNASILLDKEIRSCLKEEK